MDDWKGQLENKWEGRGRKDKEDSTQELQQGLINVSY